MGGKTISTSETKIEALRLQSSAYGVTIPVVYGVTRIPGNLFWYGGFKAIPHTTTTSAGGKGGGVKTQNTTYTYEAAIMVGLCEGEISGIGVAWRGKEYFAGGPAPDQILTAEETYNIPGGGGTYVVANAATYSADLGVWLPALAGDFPGGEGWSRVGGTYTFDATYGGYTATIRYQYLAPGATQSALAALGLSFAKGAVGQPVWSYLTTDYPAQAIGYSGISYVFASAYDLGSGAQVENHTFEVQAKLAYHLGTTVPDVDAALVGYDMLSNERYGAMFPALKLGPVDQWSAYCRAANLLLSPALTEQVAAAELLQSLAEITNTGLVWSEGMLKFIPYGDKALTGNGATYTPNTSPVYDLDDRFFIVDGDSQPVRQSIRPRSDSHNHVRIEFVNRANQYNVEIAEAKDQADIDTYGLRTKATIRAHWINDATVARNVAQLVLQRSLYIRRTWEFRLPWDFMLLEPMDLVTLTDATLGLALQPARIVEIEDNEEGELRVIAEEFPVGSATATTYPTQVGEGFVQNYGVAPGSVDSVMLFEAPAALTVTGLEVYIAADSSSPNWGGARVWVSMDGTNYREAGVLYGSSRVGALASNTFSRGSTATYIDAGLLKYAAINEPRYQNGVPLREAAADNILLRSQELDNVQWSKSTGVVATANAAVAPDGSTTAEHVIEGTTNQRHWVGQSRTIVANTAYTFSVFAKQGARRYIGVVFGKSGTPFTRAGLVIDLQTGAKTADYNNGTVSSVIRHTAVNIGNGWWRIAVTVVMDATSTDGYAEVWPSDTGTGSNYLGNGTSGVYVWGAQLEQGSAPTSYIPTVAAQASRSADAGWDFDVQGIVGQIISGSTADANALATLCYIGGSNPEYVAYTDAILTGPGAYTLRSAVRGAYSTAQAAHLVGDPFVRVDGAIVKSGPLDLGMIGKTIYVKLTSFNIFGAAEQSLADVAPNTYTITGAMAKLPPAAPASLSVASERFGVRLSCPKSADPDVVGYEFRVGSTWDGATVLEPMGGTSYLWQVQATGSQTFWVAAVDAFGNKSTPVSGALTITAPSVNSLSSAIVGREVVLSWTGADGSFPVDTYEVRYGSTWAGGTSIGVMKATKITRVVDWSGTRTWWVAAIDARGNVGTAQSTDANIAAPGVVTSGRAEVVDNNVLLYWAAPATGSLPIERYEVRKGATWAGGTVIGSNGNSTFCSVFEQASGTYTYWIAAFDTAGNQGTPSSIVAVVNQPPDYVLRSDYNSTFATGGICTTSTRTNMALDNGTLVGPVNTTDTFAQHFTNNSWTTPQNQIDAGYPLYIQPSVASGSYEEVLDYGASIPSTVATVTVNTSPISGTTPTVSCQIYWKLNIGDGWTAAAAGTSALLSSTFRYLRVVLTFTGAAGTNLLRVNAVNVKLSMKLRTDSGSDTSSVGGKTVNFNYAFVGADTPVVQPQGLDGSSKPYVPAVIYAGGANPTSFTVRIFNSAGTEVSGVTFSWTARGY